MSSEVFLQIHSQLVKFNDNEKYYWQKLLLKELVFFLIQSNKIALLLRQAIALELMESIKLSSSQLI